MINMVILAAAEGEGGSFWETAAPIIPHPGELIVGLICFFIVLAVFSKVVVPMLEKAHSERVAAIQGGMDEAEREKKEAQELLEQYRAQLAGAKDEANQIRETARADAATLTAEMREKATAEAARIVENAGRQVEADRQQALISLRSEVGTLATTLAGRIVGESLTDQARQSGIIDRFIADLEQADTAAAGSATSLSKDGAN